MTDKQERVASQQTSTKKPANSSKQVLKKPSHMTKGVMLLSSFLVLLLLIHPLSGAFAEVLGEGFDTEEQLEQPLDDENSLAEPEADDLEADASLELLALADETDGEELEATEAEEEPAKDSVDIDATDPEAETALREALSTASVITLSGNLVLGSTITIDAGKTISLGGSGSLVANGGFDTVTVNGVLNLSGLTITHSAGAQGTGILVNSGGSVVMASGTITGNTDKHVDCGSGITNYGSFIMNGGAVNNNSGYNGGGVHNHGFFTMNAGTISGNTGSSEGGGVRNAWQATFVLNGGAITGNTAVQYGGGGIYNSGTVNMAGGEISSNTVGSNSSGGGILNYYSLNMTGGSIIGNSGLYGGGVHNNGSSALPSTVFNMSGGEIRNNTSGYMGGGVCNAYSRAVFNLSGNAIISSNTAVNSSNNSYGGGVSNYDQSSFSMSGNAIISYNTASQGGGLSLDYSCKGTIDGGTITQNSVTRFGGGIFLWRNSTLAVSGNTVISSNTATTYGGGIGVWDGCAVTVSGNALIANNSANYGGGFYCINYDGCAINLQGGTVADNRAAADGGGIYTASLALLTVGEDVVFRGNSARWATERVPANNAVYLSNILLGEGENRWSAPLTQGYNNFDINQSGTKIVFVVLTYDGNGSTGGSAPANSTYKKSSLATVADAGTLVMQGHSFLGWALDPEATEVDFVESDTFLMTVDVTLFAVWAEDLVVLTVDPEELVVPEDNDTDEPVVVPVVPVEPTVTDPNGGGDTAADIAPNNVLTEQELLALVPTILQDILGQEVATSLVSSFMQSTWALLNLVIVILGVLMAVVTVIRAASKKNRNAASVSTLEQEAKQEHRVRLFSLVATPALAVFGIVLFLLVEDMRNPMVIANAWTIFFGMLIMAATTCFVFANKKFHAEQEQEPEQQESAVKPA